MFYEHKMRKFKEKQGAIEWVTRKQNHQKIFS